MTDQELLTDLTNIFRDIFDDEGIQLSADTTAADIQNWDSLNHINLIVAIEMRYKIKFKTAEIEGLQNVGELVNAVAVKLS
jgi:acyl carrier protein